MVCELLRATLAAESLPQSSAVARMPIPRVCNATALLDSGTAALASLAGARVHGDVQVREVVLHGRGHVVKAVRAPARPRPTRRSASIRCSPRCRRPPWIYAQVGVRQMLGVSDAQVAAAILTRCRYWPVLLILVQELC